MARGSFAPEHWLKLKKLGYKKFKRLETVLFLILSTSADYTINSSV